MTGSRQIPADGWREFFMSVHVMFKAESGSASIWMNDGHGHPLSFMIIGTSARISALTGETALRITVHPKKGQKGIIVLAGMCGEEAWYHMVPLDWEGDKLVSSPTYTQEQFLNPRRIGQVYTHYQYTMFLAQRRLVAWLEVQVEDKRFTSNPNRRSAATHYIPDADLLCRYLVDEIPAEDLVKAATEFQKEETAIDLLNRQLTGLQSEHNRLLAEELRLQGLIGSLAYHLRNRWFLPRAAKELLCQVSGSVS
jgi:hypothetical protein